MKKLELHDTPEAIIDYLAIDNPEIHDLIYEASKTTQPYKGSMQPYQAALCYYLASQYPDGNVLEIGTGFGYSTFFLANACKDGLVTTITPNADEMFIAIESLNLPFKNLHFKETTSRQLYVLEMDTENTYDFILIDGDHKDINFDLENWYKRLKPNGLILLHDYSNTDSKSPCLPVYNTANQFAIDYVKDFDVLVIDSVNQYGMCGWYG